MTPWGCTSPMDGLPRSWKEAHAHWVKSRKRKWGRSVELLRIPRELKLPHYAVRLHRTDIVTWEPDGTATLNSDGWRSSVTLQRLEDCGVRVRSTEGVWTVGRYAWEDGMRVFPDGSVECHGGSAADAVNGARESKRKVRNAVRRTEYANKKRHKARMLALEETRTANTRDRWNVRSVPERVALRLEGIPIPDGCTLDGPILHTVFRDRKDAHR